MDKRTNVNAGQSARLEVMNLEAIFGYKEMIVSRAKCTRTPRWSSHLSAEAPGALKNRLDLDA